MHGAPGIGADPARAHGPLMAQEIDPQRRIARVHLPEVDGVIGSVLARMTAGASPREDLLAKRDRAGAELSIELGVELLRPRQAACFPKIGRARGEEERPEVGEPVFDRPEARAIAPALADVEGSLAVIALRRVGRAHIGDVVEPALLAAGTDVEIDPLDGLLGSDRVLGALEDVLDRLVLFATQPALAGLVRFAPAGRALAARAGRRLAPFQHPVLEGRTLGQIVDWVHRAGVRHGVHRQGGGVDGAGSRPRDQLPFQGMLRHARREELRDAAVLGADEAVDLSPFRVVDVCRSLQRIVRDVAGAAAHADSERRLDRAVEEPGYARVAVVRIARQGSAMALPALQRSVQLPPLLRIETRVGELAKAEGTARGPEFQIAGALPLIPVSMRGSGLEGRILEVAGRIAIGLVVDALLAHELEELGVARAPLEAVGLG